MTPGIGHQSTQTTAHGSASPAFALEGAPASLAHLFDGLSISSERQEVSTKELLSDLHELKPSEERLLAFWLDLFLKLKRPDLAKKVISKRPHNGRQFFQCSSMVSARSLDEKRACVIAYSLLREINFSSSIDRKSTIPRKTLSTTLPLQLFNAMTQSGIDSPGREERFKKMAQSLVDGEKKSSKVDRKEKKKRKKKTGRLVHQFRQTSQRLDPLIKPVVGFYTSLHTRLTVFWDWMDKQESPEVIAREIHIAITETLLPKLIELLFKAPIGHGGSQSSKLSDEQLERVVSPTLTRFKGDKEPIRALLEGKALLWAPILRRVISECNLSMHEEVLAASDIQYFGPLLWATTCSQTKWSDILEFLGAHPESRVAALEMLTSVPATNDSTSPSTFEQFHATLLPTNDVRLQQAAAAIEPNELQYVPSLVSKLEAFVQGQEMAPFTLTHLAAPQAGLMKQIILVKTSNEDQSQFRVFINPEITHRSEEKIIVYEGSVSVQNLVGHFQRSKTITVRALDLNGKSIEETHRGMVAARFQAACEQLQGLRFPDMIRAHNQGLLHIVKPSARDQYATGHATWKKFSTPSKWEQMKAPPSSPDSFDMKGIAEGEIPKKLEVAHPEPNPEDPFEEFDDN